MEPQSPSKTTSSRDPLGPARIRRQECLDRADWRELLEISRQIALAEPTGENYLFIAFALLRLGRLEEAAQAYQRAAESSGPAVPARLALERLRRPGRREEDTRILTPEGTELIRGAARAQPGDHLLLWVTAVLAQAAEPGRRPAAIQAALRLLPRAFERAVHLAAVVLRAPAVGALVGDTRVASAIEMRYLHPFFAARRMDRERQLEFRERCHARLERMLESDPLEGLAEPDLERVWGLASGLLASLDGLRRSHRLAHDQMRDWIGDLGLAAGAEGELAQQAPHPVLLLDAWRFFVRDLARADEELRGPAGGMPPAPGLSSAERMAREEVARQMRRLDNLFGRLAPDLSRLAGMGLVARLRPAHLEPLPGAGEAEAVEPEPAWELTGPGEPLEERAYRLLLERNHAAAAEAYRALLEERDPRESAYGFWAWAALGAGIEAAARARLPAEPWIELYARSTDRLPRERRPLGGHRLLSFVRATPLGLTFRAVGLVGEPVHLTGLAPRLVRVADRGLRARFFRGPQVLARLRDAGSPAYPAVLETAEAEIPYHVCELREGEALSDLVLAEGARGPEEGLALARSLGEAILAAHTRGVILRGVSPRRLLVSKDRRQVSLADLELAKPPDAADLTGSTSFLAVSLGREAAPELLASASESAFAADVHAFGRCLAWLFTASERPTRPDEFPDLRLWQLHTDCVDPEPERRPASMEEVLARLPAAIAPGEEYPEVGAVLGGRFTLERSLGAGAFARVYQAADRVLLRAVAVKVLKADLCRDAAAVAQFEVEAQALAALNHPHVITIHDVAREGARVYLVMELVEGGRSLQRLLNQGERPAPRRALDLVRQAALGLGAAHEKGVVHKDVKPSNLLLVSDRQLKVADFGLAVNLERAGRASAFRGGTRLYMSPEQLRSLPLDHRTDIYSLGVVLYYALTGSHPYEGEEPLEQIVGICSAPLPAHDPRLAGLPAGVVALLRRMMAREREERPPDMAEVAAEIQGQLALLARR